MVVGRVKGWGELKLMPQIASLTGIGWKIRLQGNGRNFFLSLAKELVFGNLLNKGDDVYYYLIDMNGRKAIITFLDSKPLQTSKKIMIKE